MNGQWLCVACALQPLFVKVHPKFMAARMRKPLTEFSIEPLIAEFGSKAAPIIISVTDLEHSSIKYREQVEQVRLHQAPAFEDKRKECAQRPVRTGISPASRKESNRKDEINGKAALMSTGCYWCGDVTAVLERDCIYPIPFLHGADLRILKLYWYELMLMLRNLVMVCPSCNSQRGARCSNAVELLRKIQDGRATLTMVQKADETPEQMRFA